MHTNNINTVYFYLLIHKISIFALRHHLLVRFHALASQPITMQLRTHIVWGIAKDIGYLRYILSRRIRRLGNNSQNLITYKFIRSLVDVSKVPIYSATNLLNNIRMNS